jgi:hypothetical protein
MNEKRDYFTFLILAYCSFPSSNISHSIKSDSSNRNSLTMLAGIVARKDLDLVFALVNLVMDNLLS